MACASYSEAVTGGWKTKAGLALGVAWMVLARFVDLGDLYDPVLLLIEALFGVGIGHKAVKLSQARRYLRDLGND